MIKDQDLARREDTGKPRKDEAEIREIWHSQEAPGATRNWREEKKVLPRAFGGHVALLTP